MLILLNYNLNNKNYILKISLISHNILNDNHSNFILIYIF